MSNWVALLVNVLVGIVLTPYMFAYLGQRQYGLWTLSMSLVGYFGLLRLGIGGALIRYVPVYRSRNDIDGLNNIVSTSLSIYSILGLFVLAASIAFGGAFSKFFNAGTNLSTIIKIMGMAAAIELPSLILEASLRGYEAFVITNIAIMSQAIIRSGLLLICIHMQCSLSTMAWAHMIATSLALCIKYFCFRVTCGEVKLSPRNVRYREFKIVLGFGIFVVFSCIGRFLTQEAPKQIIAKLISIETLASFGVIMLLLAYFNRFIQSLTRVFVPRFSYLSGGNKQDEICTLFLRATKPIAILASMAAMLLWSLGPTFLSLWVEKLSLSPGMVWAFYILLAGTLVFVTHHISVQLLYGVGHEKRVALYSVLEGVGALIFALCLALPFGVVGIAVGVVVPMVLVRAVVQTRFVCRSLGLGLGAYYRGAILPAWLSSILLAVLTHQLHVAQLITSWTHLISSAGVLVVVYALLVYLVVLNPAERNSVLNWFVHFHRVFLSKRQQTA